MDRLWKLAIMCAGLLLLAGCAALPTVTPQPTVSVYEQEVWDLELDAEAWYTGWVGASQDHLLRWYMPEGQPRDDAGELVTSLYSLEEASPRQAYEAFVERAALNCPSFESSVLDEPAGSLLFEWRRGDDCPREAPAWHEIVRVAAAEGGTAYLSYARRGGALSDDERGRWLSLIGGAQLRLSVEAAIGAKLASLPSPPMPTATPSSAAEATRPGDLPAGDYGRTTLDEFVQRAFAEGVIAYGPPAAGAAAQLDGLREIYPAGWQEIYAAWPVTAWTTLQYGGRSREILPARAEMVRTWFAAADPGALPSGLPRPEAYGRELQLAAGERQYWLVADEELAAKLMFDNLYTDVSLRVVLVGLDGRSTREPQPVFVLLGFGTR